ncbi:MAG TPA: sodium:proton antiporter [Accumulibacter sp.]|uniref:cation:proton antiporter n=1 Tax=Accumulibacter sp. TaxID=2053492 RepID=UPI0025F089EB|nr:sodium:proton antiporter [Accumulibacter sp.]MCM8598679.1 sodium:proton antiporter [Accumulibacter sp.]MCM8662829.1 sodium:proton antiporter [Accumulibacter sp.]HNC50882.1 sodium:proton antiporter [Accumulibacter sp.]
MDSPSSIDLAKSILQVFMVLLGFGMLARVAAVWIKIPDIVVFLIVGILLGPEVSGLVAIQADSALNQIILIFGACYLLFDGGASLRFSVLKEVWITIVVIATLGVLVTATITGFAAYHFLGLPLLVAMLLGAAIASTDPATLVPIFRQVHVRDRVAQMVVSESALNDATGAVSTFAVLAVATGSGEFSAATAVGDFFFQSGVGLLAGAVLGYAAAFIIGHRRFDFLAEYAPLVTLMAVMAAFLSADGLHASGFMAVFVFGLMLGNKESFGFAMDSEEGRRLDEFVMTTALIARMLIFLLLGSQIDFRLMEKYFFGAALVVTVFMLVARPAAVFLCALPDRRAKWSLEELLFMCWTRETGVIPAALAGLLLGVKAPGAEVIAAVTFVAIIMTILIQATTTKWLARRLGLLVE